MADITYRPGDKVQVIRRMEDSACANGSYEVGDILTVSSVDSDGDPSFVGEDKDDPWGWSARFFRKIESEEQAQEERKENFTPGPWHIDRKSIIGAKIKSDTQDHGFIKEVCDVSCAENKTHNAKLIAAAPEMYEALKIGAQDLHTAASMLLEVHEALLITVKQMQAALAKARGE